MGEILVIACIAIVVIIAMRMLRGSAPRDSGNNK